jgi:hypothetical protein
MPSLTQTLFDKWNGVVHDTQVAITKLADEAIALVPKDKKAARTPPAPLTEQQKIVKEQLKDMLRTGELDIEFTKVDGTPTTMRATLDQRLIPQANPTTITVAEPAKSEQQEHLLHVYATDRQGWRSFAVANVKKVSRP